MDPVTKQYLIALAAIAVGLSGWLLPDKYNILKLKASIAKHVSPGTNIKIARAVGTVLIVGGVLMVFATWQVGELK